MKNTELLNKKYLDKQITLDFKKIDNLMKDY